jgi:hypothetical protein
MRDFLYSEIANLYGIPKVPDDPDLAIEAGRRLCAELLQPMQQTFGRIAIRSACRSAEVQITETKGIMAKASKGTPAITFRDSRDNAATTRKFASPAWTG